MRRGCASRQTVQLSLLPSHPAVDCTHCNKRLRLWPDLELPFLCDQCHFQSCQGWPVVRSGFRSLTIDLSRQFSHTTHHHPH